LSHYAYVDSLWNGEGFVWNNVKEYYLTAVSGLCFGLSGDTLGSPNPYLGFMTGQTERNSDIAQGIWDFWDSVSIEEMTLVGWWEDDAFVSVDVDDVEATVFYKYGERAIISVGSYIFGGVEANMIDVKLVIDWDALGLDRDNVKVSYPKVIDQEETTVDDVEEIFQIEANNGGGRVILIETTK